MGEFSSQWLSLREPVDHAARSGSVASAVLADLKQRMGAPLSGVRVLDLGCGSGSNLRALAPELGDQQHWRLVDYDDELLRSAGTVLRQWADEVKELDDNTWFMLRGDLRITVNFQRADLTTDLRDLLSSPVDLVTASALFDLVSAAWVDDFVAHLNAPLYAVLSFDGLMQWLPTNPLDASVAQAFAQHQQQDKGFGPALGPKSGQYLKQALHAAQFEVLSDKSPWQVDSLPSAFHDMLLDGIASAAIEMGAMTEQVAAHWSDSRRVAQQCIIGHDDLYASKTDLKFE